MTLEELKNGDQLNLYLMGLLPEQEALEVENLLINNPELLIESKDTEDALLGYANEFRQTPPPSLKSKIMGEIETLNQANIVTQKAPIEIKKSFNWYSIAASVLLCVSVGLGYTLVQKNARIDDLTAKIVANDLQLAENNSTTASYRETLNSLYQNDVQQVKLKSTDTAKNVFATFFYNKSKKQLLIHQGNLEERRDGMQYQVWALIDGKPISAGVFDAASDSDSLKVIKTDLNAQLFAVSIEKRGGAETPTPERIILISGRI
ncbi:MAG: anti-sigma factor [bacterium]|nr:anti-sigma factor [bacterium]